MVRSPLHAYDLMVEKDELGEEPMYRPRREWRIVERANERRAKKSDWFKLLFSYLQHLGEN